MTRPKQLQQQHKIEPRRQLQLQLLLLLLFVLLQLLPAVEARPQQQLLLEAVQSETIATAAGATTGAATAPALNDPSDLSAGLNLLPVSNWIAAAANAEPPAPAQFVRIAMNSGL
ncbi:uncharacterized protein LOC135440057 [Drosophila montana]|uniref:uncharacterized protein LOC135440057 n=1 Tax=Drosophila montana TaxID=40370 RepID=UPI00313DD787